MFRRKFILFLSLFYLVATSYVFSANDSAVDNKLNIESQMEEALNEMNEDEIAELDPKNTLYIELKDGIVVAELYSKIAPKHVQRIRELVADGFYDDIVFHRVIPNFMAQAGDPTGTGTGGSKMGRLSAEFSNEKHVRGILSMARAADENSANSQFFIVTGPAFPQLDGQYTVFGKVLQGMEYVDRIKAGTAANNGIVSAPDKMLKVITGDMLNNKSLDIVKEEIKIINEVQNEKVLSDPNYQKKPILSILYAMRNVDVLENEDEDDEEQENDESGEVQDNKQQGNKQNTNKSSIESGNKQQNNKLNKKKKKSTKNNVNSQENTDDTDEVNF
jgi:peptidylprolyl isomerase